MEPKPFINHQRINAGRIINWILILLLVLVPSSGLVSIETNQYNTGKNGSIRSQGSPYKDGAQWNRAFQTPSSSKSTCSCWISYNYPFECKCYGQQVSRIPNDLDPMVQSITLLDCAIEKLRKNDLQPYRNTLVDFIIDKADQLTSIEEGLFNGLHQLHRIFIQHAKLLTHLPVNVFQVYLPKLRVLTITQTGLREFPILAALNTGDTILHQIDFNDNKIEYIPTNSVRLRTDDFLLSHNAIRFIEAAAFNGSQIATLNLRGNHELTHLDLDVFIGLESLRQLDLSETAITVLPIHGLSDLEILLLKNTHSLKEIPSVYHYKSLLEAYLTYPYHCCAFKFPATHDPDLHAQHTHMIEEMQKMYCNETTDQPNERGFNQSSDSGFNDGVFYLGVELNPQSSLNFGEGDLDNGFFHETAVGTNQDNSFHAYCGKLSVIPRHLQCSPQPDAFNPCEDIMGTRWLRVAVWVVASASVVGNLAVIIVLPSSRSPMAVSKFLMMNLAVADLFMGIYLFLIAGMDFHSSGVYFNYANDWQNGMGCKIAGFLTVFSTELSIFTLVVITSERWLTITYAVNLNKRLRLSLTRKIVAFGWIGAIIMAALPLTGVSNFSTTSICLPLGVQNVGDFVYILLLLVGNALGFISICLFYGHMYHSISDRQNSLASHSDAKVAKKMALLVFTNLACLAPITFFGLTAVIGYPLIDVTHSKILLVFVYPLNACTNPYLYAVLTKQYRRDFYSVLSRHGICQERAGRVVSSARLRHVRANPQFQSVLYRQTTNNMSKVSKKSNKVIIDKNQLKNSQNDSDTMRQPNVNNIRIESDSTPTVENSRDTNGTAAIVKRPTSVSMTFNSGEEVLQQLVKDPVEEANDGGNVSDSMLFLTQTDIHDISPCGMKRNTVGSPHPVKHCLVHLRQRDIAVSGTCSSTVQIVSIAKENQD